MSSPRRALVPTASPRRGHRRRGRTDPHEDRSAGHRASGLLTVFAWLLAAYFMLPLVWLFFASTKDNTDLITSFGLWFGERNHLLDNVRGVLASEYYLRWAVNTVVYSVLGSVGCTALSALAGYGFAKYRFPGARALFAVVLGTIMVPMTALAIPTYLLFSKAHLVNTLWGMVLPSLVSPFGVYLMRVYCADAVPDSMLEAARVDGAGELTIFWRIGLPLMAPGLTTVGLFALVTAWNSYLLPLMVLSERALYPLTVGLAQWGRGPGAVTGAALMILPLIAAFLALQRFWQAGLIAGHARF